MNDTRNNGGPAFPCHPDDEHPPYDGMTLRDYFAAKAIIAYHADGEFSSPEDAAVWCYRLADAMLEARAEEEE
jgi:hypothetical protein